MSDRCPQDGGFIGDAGCTHPNHAHSERVQKIVDGAKNPAMIRAEDATAALEEGFYVENPNGQRVGFGKRLLGHVGTHGSADANARLARLQFAVATVTSPSKVEKDHRGIEGRTAYTKSFKEFGMLVITDAESENAEYAFTIVPKRKKKRAGSRAGCFLQDIGYWLHRAVSPLTAESIPQNAPKAQGGRE